MSPEDILTIEANLGITVPKRWKELMLSYPLGLMDLTRPDGSLVREFEF